MFGRIEGCRINTARECPPGGGNGEVVGPGQAGDAVEQNDHIPMALDQPFGPFQGHLGHPHMVLHRFVKGAADHFRIHRAIHIGDLFRSLADQYNHQVQVFVVGAHAIGYAFEDCRLTRFGRADNQTALSAPDGREQVDQPGGKQAGFCLQQDLLVGEDGNHLLEVGATLGLFRVQSVDSLHLEQTEILLRLFGWAHLPGHQIARAQAKAPNLALADIYVVRAGQQMFTAQEADAILYNIQNATAKNIPLLLCIGAQQAHNQVILFQSGIPCDLHGAG